MIIKGKSRAGPAALAKHLGNAEKNERVTLIETKGTIAQDLRGALVEMDAYAAGTKCEKSLYHAAISPEPPHRLTPEQRREAIDALEEKLGLTGHARVVVMHEKLGREHIHVVWSRIDLERMQSVSDSHNYRKHEEVARDLERRFGHDRVQGALAERDDVARPDRTPTSAELRQEERTGIKIKAVKADVTAAAFRAGDDAHAFCAALEEKGYILAKGDRRDFVIVDRAGGIHSLARRMEGMKAAALRAFMAPIDRESLPSAKEAKAIAEDRRHGRQPAQELEEWEDALADSAIRKAKQADRNQRANADRAAASDRAHDAERFKERRWEDALDRSAVAKARKQDEEDERRRRGRKEAQKDAKIEAKYSRGEDYVSQSRAALEHHKRREKRIEEKFASVEMTEAQQKRMQRLLDGGDGGRDDELEPDRQREVPGGGRTRSR